jgi:RNA-splicing ligase RtcB
MPTTINDKLVSWASDIDDETVRQAEKAARLPIVEGHVALMPDAHVGIGATVGSVIPTKNAVIPSAVGVDIGCGMIAAELDVLEDRLPDSLEPLLARMEKAIPAGVGQGHDRAARAAERWLAAHKPASQLAGDQTTKAARQFGTLGSGDAAMREVFGLLGFGRETRRINAHHNFTQREVHNGEELWITRKGAIKADTGDLGVIPGSMGTRSYIVRGRGSEASWRSCSHGAGRRHSRTRARKLFTSADLAAQMAGKVWLARRAHALVDEIPAAYKDIDQVMADQSDLVEVVHTLRQVLNYKGT